MTQHSVSFYQDEPFVKEAFESILKSFEILKDVCAQNHLVTSPEIRLGDFRAALNLWNYSLKAAEETTGNMIPNERILIHDLNISGLLGVERARANFRRLWDLLDGSPDSKKFYIQSTFKTSAPLDTVLRVEFKD